MSKTLKVVSPFILLAALILLSAPAQAQGQEMRRTTFKTTFASGAEATVQMRHKVGRNGEAGKARPHRIFIKRADGGRVLWNLNSGKVYKRTAPGKGKKMRTRTTLMGSDKVMYLLRGCSGSGKSTLAKKVAPGAPIYSTDDFFMKSGRYQFDVKKLGKAHGWNQKRAEAAAKKGKGPIIIDNTMTRAWEARAYVEAALENGFRIKIKEPTTPWKFNAKELAKRNSHGVSEQIIAKQISHYEHGITVADILKANK